MTIIIVICVCMVFYIFQLQATTQAKTDCLFYLHRQEVNEMNLTFRVDTIQRQANVLPHPQQAQRVNDMPMQMSRNP